MAFLVKFPTGAVKWSLLSQLVTGLSLPLSAGLIATRTTAAEQGFYYTFSSLLALQVFVELGLSGCLSQFVSAEFASLQIIGGRIRGEQRNMSRLGGLARLSFLWYGFAALLFLLSVGIIGEMVLQSSTTAGVSWRAQWWLLCFTTSINLTLTPAAAIVEGCNQIASTAAARLVQSIIKALTLVITLAMSGGLWAPALAAVAGTFAYWVLVGTRWGRMIKDICITRNTHSISWSKEIFPFQWRIGLSWISGYLIFSSLTPTIFLLSGAETAGRFGLSWSVLQGISSLAQVFIQARQPMFAMHLARGEKRELKQLWKVASWEAVSTASVLSGFVVVTTALLSSQIAVLSRVVPVSELMLLGLAVSLNQYTMAVAALIRANREEHFVVVSLLSGLGILEGTIMLSNDDSTIYVSANYLFWMLVAAAIAKKIHENFLAKIDAEAKFAL